MHYRLGGLIYGGAYFWNFTVRINILYINFFSFPGGKKDPEDSSLIETAIREMDEELGLHRRHVEVWAPMPTIPDRVRHCLSKIS